MTDSRGLSVAAAADRLGLTPDAVRGRLHRGTLSGYKVATEWRVFLPDAAEPTGGRQATATGQQPGTGERQAARADRQAGDTPDDAPLVALVADLARCNEELAAAAGNVLGPIRPSPANHATGGALRRSPAS